MTKLIHVIVVFCISLASFAGDFTIKKDSHYSTPVMKKPFHKNKLEFRAAFNETAIYTFDTANASDQGDTNKLFGFGDCGDSHMENSARFGWRWYNNQLQIMAFTHKNGVFDYKFISEASLGRIYTYTIGLSSDKTKYIFNFNNVTVEMERGCNSDRANGYTLQPYFGGNQPAPHDINIKLDFNDDYANFSYDLIYPNPTKDNFVKINMNIDESMDIGFHFYDILGRLVWDISPQSFSGEQEYKGFQLNFSSDISSGVYLIVPYAKINGEENFGVYSGKGDAAKLIILK